MEGERVEKDRAGPWLTESLHGTEPAPSRTLDSSSDVRRAEQLADSPNPSVAPHPDGDDTWVTPEPYGSIKTSAPPTTFHPFSIHVLSLLMSSSVFGTLARLGIHALATYNGESIFPLAWVQAVGCGIMGFAFAMRDPITLLYAALSALNCRRLKIVTLP